MACTYFERSFLSCKQQKSMSSIKIGCQKNKEILETKNGKKQKHTGETGIKEFKKLHTIPRLITHFKKCLKNSIFLLLAKTNLV